MKSAILSLLNSIPLKIRLSIFNAGTILIPSFQARIGAVTMSTFSTIISGVSDVISAR